VNGQSYGCGGLHLCWNFASEKLQALCYWVCDQQKHGQALDHEDWDIEMMASTIERMHIDKEQEQVPFWFPIWASLTLKSLKLVRQYLLTCCLKLAECKVKALSMLLVMLTCLLCLQMMPKGTCTSCP
jgi:hypothetical protein